MSEKRILVIIPARYNSEEIFCKTLADIAGKPMIQWVYERVQVAQNVESVMVATDHEKIKKTVEAFGGKAVMTSTSHICGADRIVEAYSKLGEEFDVVVNVQADEPFIEPAMLEEVTKPLLDNPDIPMGTLCCRFNEEKYDFSYPFNVKVVKDLNNFALYFSRSPIPYQRKEGAITLYQHIGIYAYQGWFLKDFPKGPSSLEKTESLEQLRVLENGYKIKVVETGTDYQRVCVDTEEDLENARKIAATLKK
ncbi:MAG: 3-deoxy-manno-octulosonate cytidylyltransferase [Candidatus Hodarchaeota archaeon]